MNKNVTAREAGAAARAQPGRPPGRYSADYGPGLSPTIL